jgi:hypothetical protein
MATDFQQTDTNATGGAVADHCSGNTSSTDTDSNQADKDGSAGSTPRTHQPDNLAADLNGVWMEIINIDNYDGASGTWITRLNVTAGNHQLTLDEIWICHVDSGFSAKNTLGNLTGLADNLSATGVRTHNVTQSSSVSIATGDIIIVIYAFDNAQNMTQTFQYTPDQITQGPGTVSAPGITPIPSHARVLRERATSVLRQ